MLIFTLATHLHGDSITKQATFTLTHKRNQNL